MRKKLSQNSFRVKILISISMCIVFFCLLCSLFIASILGKRLFQKSEHMDMEYAAVITAYMDDIYNNVNRLAVLARSNTYVTRALENPSLSTSRAMRQALNAQTQLDTYLSAFPLNSYVNRLLVFNVDSVLIAGTGVLSGETSISVQRLKESRIWQEHHGDRTPVFALGPSLTDPQQEILAYLYPMDGFNTSFLYMEFDVGIFTRLLEPYRETADIVLAGDGGQRWYSSEALAAGMEGRDPDFKLDQYVVNERRYEPFRLTVQTLTMRSLLSNDNRYIAYILLLTLLAVMAAGVVVSRLVSRRITEPLNRLSAHIRKLSDEEQLAEDPEIEQGGDEISAIGKVVNGLVRHINSLIERQKEMYEQKQRLEIDALQSQINPHFLYNTLDSIRWMAVIRKAEGIARTVGALENLLRNMSKGIGSEITLAEELSLAQDYVSLQQVRYVEIFDYVCEVPAELKSARIVKMTLQPIIENAILHGIEPTGSYGEIRLSAYEKDGDLWICVEDNGAGMDEAELAQLGHTMCRRDRNAMSGIGISNVDARLKMTYGPAYGLTYESEKNRYTRVTVHIPFRVEE